MQMLLDIVTGKCTVFKKIVFRDMLMSRSKLWLWLHNMEPLVLCYGTKYMIWSPYHYLREALLLLHFNPCIIPSNTNLSSTVLGIIDKASPKWIFKKVMDLCAIVNMTQNSFFLKKNKNKCPIGTKIFINGINGYNQSWTQKMLFYCAIVC